ncbi:hypothetical protein [Aestuariibaculum marinum]|uniref:Uncharacterized protein n=1 Tax=Aestuariibaculum marinum TaxID=2683592 RepID=A0A8J6U6D3_9FLAO|nr:hypothetical protein [Aestuariibaculum marinum]MBD0822656.1 hypothetical protein [Aestuariibaculum marinum]
MGQRRHFFKKSGGRSSIDLTQIGVLNISARVSSPRQMQIKNDGSMAFVLDYSTDRGALYSLSTSLDIETGSYLRYEPSNNSAGWSYWWRDDGLMLYSVSLTGIIYRSECISPYDSNGATVTTFNTGISGYSASIIFSDDGLTYWVGSRSSQFKQFTVSTAWDILTSVLDYTIALTTYGFGFLDSGQYFLYNAGDNVYLRKLSTPYNVSTMGDIIDTFTHDLSQGGNTFMSLDPNGQYIYIVSDGVDSIYQLEIL